MKKKTIKKIGENSGKKLVKNKKKSGSLKQITYQKEEVFNLQNYLINDSNLKIKELNDSQDELKKIIEGETLSHYFLQKSEIIEQNKNIIQAEKKIKTNSYQSPYLIDLRINEVAATEVKSKKINLKEPLLKNKLIIRDRYKKLISLVKLKNNGDGYFNFLAWHRFKTAINFFVICLLIIGVLFGFNQFNNIYLLKEKVSIKSAKALTDLLKAAESTNNKNFQEAKINFNLASLNFLEAKEELESYNNVIWQIASQLPPTEKKISAVKKIFSAGEKITQAAGELTNFFDNQANYLGNKPLIESVKILDYNLKIIIENLEILNDSLKDLDSSIIPASYKENFDNSLKILPELINNFTVLDQSLSVLNDILAYDGQKNYLIFFQNTNELRATGGFLGSYAFVNINKGEINKLEIPGGGPYDLKGSLTKKVIAPEPMQLIGSRWQIWDANWWPDLPTTAKKINWFYEASNGPTVDGIFLINSDILPRLMEITGNIYLEKYDKNLSSANVINNLQHAVEFEYDKEQNQPKQIIGDFAPLLLDKLFKIQNDKITDLLSVLVESFENKDLQIYFTDNSTEQKIIDLDWAGQIKNSEGDYLMVVNQNIGGGKTDGVVEQKIIHHSEITSSGELYDTVSVIRKHNGNPDDILEKTNNISYIRIYVPAGSQLIEVSGSTPPPAEAFKKIADDYTVDNDLVTVSGFTSIDKNSGTRINQEFGKTVFGQWQQVKPGEEKILTIKYRLPFVLTEVKNKNFVSQFLDLFNKSPISLKKYTLLIQKQSGSKNSIISQLILPSDKKVIWLANSKNFTVENEGQKLIFYGKLVTDQSYAVIID